MSFFGICFLLYFFKLSAGHGFWINMLGLGKLFISPVSFAKNANYLNHVICNGSVNSSSCALTFIKDRSSHSLSSSRFRMKTYSNTTPQGQGYFKQSQTLFKSDYIRLAKLCHSLCQNHWWFAILLPDSARNFGHALDHNHMHALDNNQFAQCQNLQLCCDLP